MNMTPRRHEALRLHARHPPNPKGLKLFPSQPSVCRQLEDWMAAELPAYAKEENRLARLAFVGHHTNGMSDAERRAHTSERKSIVLSTIKLLDGSATAQGLAESLQVSITRIRRTLADLMDEGEIEVVTPGAKPIYYRVTDKASEG